MAGGTVKLLTTRSASAYTIGSTADAHVVGRVLVGVLRECLR